MSGRVIEPSIFDGPSVQRLAAAISYRLVRDHWGDLPPELFQNIGDGRLDKPDEELLFNKCSATEAREWSYALTAILEESLIEAGYVRTD